jgi:ribonuclease HII
VSHSNTELFFHKNSSIEKEAWQNNKLVCGIDEAGRGCLFGPLVTAAAILPVSKKSRLLKDSKVLTEQEREKAFAWIEKNCFYSYIITDSSTIDKRNIYQATIWSMKKAFMHVIEVMPYELSKIQFLVIDAVPITLPTSYSHENLTVLHPTHAEKLSPSVAAASIVAKVMRDRLMNTMSHFFPLYSIDKHKGYGTEIHIQALATHGHTIIHRKSFISHMNTNPKGPHEHQQTIC